MNIFYLSDSPKIAAQYHTNTHSIKMILEYAQLLSTAHRLLDGTQTVELSKSNRKVKRWILDDERNDTLYSATHINHPSAVWARYSLKNYLWLSELLSECCTEYTLRYGKTHKVQSSGLMNRLFTAPKNISINKGFTEPTPAMPDEYKVPCDSVMSYRNYYLGSKTRMLKYRNRDIPDWIIQSNIGTVEEKLDKDSNMYKIYKVDL